MKNVKLPLKTYNIYHLLLPIIISYKAVRSNDSLFVEPPPCMFSLHINSLLITLFSSADSADTPFRTFPPSSLANSATCIVKMIQNDLTEWIWDSWLRWMDCRLGHKEPVKAKWNTMWLQPGGKEFERSTEMIAFNQICNSANIYINS